MPVKDLNKERLELALDAAGLDLWENNLLTGEVTQAASKTYLELGYLPDETPHLVNSLFTIVHPDDREMILTALQRMLTGGQREYRCEFRLLKKSGDWVWYANYGRIVDTDSATPGERFIGVSFNIDDRKRKEAEIAQINLKLEEQNRMLQLLASTEPLTGLSNRRTLMEQGDKACSRAQQSCRPLSMLMLDIDAFKSINDRWGHQTGDRVICAAAETCNVDRREGSDIVARLGGEEFVLMLPDTDGHSAAESAEKLRALLATRQVFSDDGEPVGFTVSIGVACFERGITMDRFLTHADKALYLAKKNGRNRVQRFEDMAGHLCADTLRTSGASQDPG